MYIEIAYCLTFQMYCYVMYCHKKSKKSSNYRAFSDKGLKYNKV